MCAVSPVEWHVQVQRCRNYKKLPFNLITSQVKHNAIKFDINMYLMIILSAPRGVTRIAGANAQAAKLAISPTITVHKRHVSEHISSFSHSENFSNRFSQKRLQQQFCAQRQHLANLVHYIISFRPHPIKFSKDFAQNALGDQTATGIVNNEVYHSDDRISILLTFFMSQYWSTKKYLTNICMYMHL